MKKVKSVKYFNYLSSLVSDARFTREIKPRFVMAKTEFSKKCSFLQQIWLGFQEETSEILHFGAFLCIVPKLGHLGKQIKNTWKFWKQELDKGAEALMGPLCEKWKCITNNQERKWRPIYKQTKESKLNWTNPV
jgi:hypothetical protein